MSEFAEKNNIYLVGFMGAGKTTVGKVLSRKLQKPFFDLDIEIASFCKATIKDIFKKEGEDFFRETETKVLQKISSVNSNAIVSTGGGVVIKDQNWDLMNSTGKVVYLKASLESIWQRVKASSTRPLLNVDNAFEKAAELLSFREQFYKKADITIDTADLSVEETAEEIANSLSG